MAEQRKIKFSGVVESVQPRSNVWRYRLDNRNHSTTGYNIFLKGVAEEAERNDEGYLDDICTERREDDE